MRLVTRKKKDKAAGGSDWTHQRIWKDTSQTAYISGLFLDGGRLRVSYGSSDIDARLLSMSVPDVEELFDAPPDCSASEVLDAGSGTPMAAQLTQEAGLLGTAAARSSLAAAAGSGSASRLAAVAVVTSSLNVTGAGELLAAGSGSSSGSRQPKQLARHRRTRLEGLLPAVPRR
jgi:hypothetical protein